MSIEKLHIKELSPSGELLGVLTCHAGQITVFRAVNNSDLAKYLRALAGVPGKDRFSISVDDSEFIPSQHNLIGFGERFSSADSSLSVEEFLSAHGAPPQSIGALLSAAGLEERSKNSCGSLTSDEERRLRILSATCEPIKVLVLNDPFDPISSSWRERFAELLNDFVRTKNGLVVVPFLSYRPESWIDNERVARLQVGQNVQKTIGFGTAPSQVHSVIQQIRQEAQQPTTPLASAENIDGSLRVEEADETAPPIATKGFERDSRLVIGALGVLVVVGIIIGISFSGVRESEDNNIQIVSNIPESSAQSESSITSVASLSSVAILPSPEPQPTLIPTAEPPPQVQMARLLDLYPAAIRASIVESFEGLSSGNSGGAALDSPRVSRSKPRSPGGSVAPRRNTSELLSVLETTSTNKPAEAAPAQPSDSELEGMSPEQRREVIRQRFLEAIQRASQQQQ